MPREKKSQMTKGNRKEEPKRMIEFRFVKSGDYASFPVDGFYGGWTPTGRLHLDCYLERREVPDLIVAELDKDNKPTKQEAIGGKGLVRERLCGLYLPAVTAVALHDWLGERIAEGLENGIIEEKN